MTDDAPRDTGAPSGPSVTARQPKAIRSALAVLEAVAELGPGTTARRVSDALGLPRATTYRLVNLLVQDGYLVRTPDLAGFALGEKVRTLVSAAASAPPRLPTAARDLVAAARESVRGGLHVIAYVDGRVAVLDADPEYPLRAPDRIAAAAPDTAFGALLQAEHDDPLPDRAAIAANGYAVRGHGVGEGCLAVPIRDRAGLLTGAVGFAGAASRLAAPDALLHRLRPLAEALAPLIS